MDIGYVAYYVDNPVLKEIIGRQVDDPERCMEFETDFGPNENLTEPESLEELLEVLPKIMRWCYSLDENSLSRDIKEKKSEILCSFRYAKWNNGYQYEEVGQGRDVHYMYTSRWGTFRQVAVMSRYPDDDDEEEWDEPQWIIREPEWLEMPDAESGFFDSESDISDAQELARANQYDDKIEIESKKFCMCGCVDSYYASGSCEIQLDDSMTEAEMISYWLGLYHSSLREAHSENMDDMDYLVVRFDPCEELKTEECKQIIKNAIDRGIKIISEEQLWNVLFKERADETEKRLDSLENA